MIDVSTAVTEATRHPASIRPTWSVLAARALIASIGAALAVAGWKLDLWFLPWPFAIFAMMGAGGAVRAAVGRVYVTVDGISVRQFVRVHHIAWSDILGFDVRERISSRSLCVHVGSASMVLPVPRTSRLFADPRFNDQVAYLIRTWGERTARVVTVPAPRRPRRAALLLAIVVTLAVVAIPDRPWGWAGGQTAAAIPQACSVLGSDLATHLGAIDPQVVTVSPAQARYETYAAESECSWKLPDGGTLIVLYELYERHGLHSASDEAQHNTAVSVGDIDQTSDMTRAAASVAIEHGIPGTLFTGDNELTTNAAYVATTSRANVTVGVAATGRISLDVFASAVNVADDAAEIG